MAFIDRMTIFPASIYPQTAKPGVNADLPGSTIQDTFVRREMPDNSVTVWQTYIGFLQRLKNASPKDYESVPAVLKHLSDQQIQSLKAPDIEAFKAMHALPQDDPEMLDSEQLLTAQSYIRSVRSLRDDPKEYEKISPILKTMSDDEVEHLTPESAEALRLLDAIPDFSSVQSKKATTDDLEEALEALVKSNPDLKKIANIDDAVQFAKHPAVRGLLMARPDLKRVLDDEVGKKFNVCFPRIPTETLHLPSPFQMIAKFLLADLGWLFFSL